MLSWTGRSDWRSYWQLHPANGKNTYGGLYRAGVCRDESTPCLHSISHSLSARYLPSSPFMFWLIRARCWQFHGNGTTTNIKSTKCAQKLLSQNGISHNFDLGTVNMCFKQRTPLWSWIRAHAGKGTGVWGPRSGCRYAVLSTKSIMAWRTVSSLNYRGLFTEITAERLDSWVRLADTENCITVILVQSSTIIVIALSALPLITVIMFSC